MSLYGPTTLSLISDLFPQEHRTIAFCIYAIGSQAGYPISSFNKPLTSLIGWRNTFKLTASIGFTSAIIGLIFIKEPERGRYDIKQSLIANNALSE